MSQLWGWVAVVVCFLFFFFFFGGGGGGWGAQLPGVRRGTGGRVSFGVGCETVAVVVCFFVFLVVFCFFCFFRGGGGRVSFGVGCETVAVVVCFFFQGAGGESASGGAKGK